MLFARSKNNIKEATFSCNRDGLMIRGTEYSSEGENLSIAIGSHGIMAFQYLKEFAK